MSGAPNVHPLSPIFKVDVRKRMIFAISRIQRKQNQILCDFTLFEIAKII